MGPPLGTVLRIWAPCCAFALAGCAFPTCLLSGIELPARRWKTGPILAAEGRLFAANEEGSAVLKIDPVKLSYREMGRVSGLRSFDIEDGRLHWMSLTKEGCWVLHGPSRADIRILAPPEARMLWSSRHAVVVTADAVRFFPKSDGDPPPALVLGKARFAGVDYHRERVWALGPSGLLSAGPESRGWEPARFSMRHSNLTWQDVDVGLLAIVFGRRRFAFLDGGLIYVGEAESGTLAVDQAIDFFPDGIRDIAFSSRDDDVVLARGNDVLWAWNLPLREGRRLKPRAGNPGVLGSTVHLHFEWREGRVVRFWPHAVDCLGSDGKVVTTGEIVLDRPARILNALWDVLVFPADLAWGGVCLFTPVGPLAVDAGLAKWRYSGLLGLRGWGF